MYFRLPDLFYTKPSEPDLKHKYDKKPYHHINFRAPSGKGPHPTLFVLHGGKFRSAYRAKQTEFLCSDLAKHGVATCNIEFPRLGHVGANWHSMFHSIAEACKQIMEHADEWGIDQGRITILGHSSGAHLAFCLPKIKKFLARELAFKPASLIALAGVFDLKMAPQLQKEIDEMFGETKPFDPTSLMPLGIKQLLLCGSKDKLTGQAAAYRNRANNAGDNVTSYTIMGGTHFNIIDTTSDTYSEVRRWQTHPETNSLWSGNHTTKLPCLSTRDSIMTRLQEIQAKITEVIKLKGWHKDWCKGGCYIHLEVSEFIESLRGKGDSTPENEAADVFFTMMAVMGHYEIDPDAVLDRLNQVCEDLKAGVKGADDPELKPDPESEPEKRYFFQVIWKNGTTQVFEITKGSWDFWQKGDDGEWAQHFNNNTHCMLTTPTGRIEFKADEVLAYQLFQ